MECNPTQQDFLTFTIHFATINTRNIKNVSGSCAKFTIHFATINTLTRYVEFQLAMQFTIHFATINTKLLTPSKDFRLYLQYTLLLLILLSELYLLLLLYHLQYTLLLLIRKLYDRRS